MTAHFYIKTVFLPSTHLYFPPACRPPGQTRQSCKCVGIDAAELKWPAAWSESEKNPGHKRGGRKQHREWKGNGVSTGKSAEGEAQGEDQTPVISDPSAHTVMHMNTHTQTHRQAAAWRKAWWYVNHKSTKKNIIPRCCIKNLHVQPLSIFFYHPVLRQKETSSFNTFAGMDISYIRWVGFSR